MGENDAVEGNGTERLGADVIALLGRGEQGVQHLDRGLEHLDEFEETLIGMAKPAGKRVRIRIVLAEMLQFPDVDFADEGGDILVVLVAGFRLGDRDLTKF